MDDLLLGSLVELKSGETGEVVVKLSDKNYSLQHSEGGRITTFNIKDIKQIKKTKQMIERYG